MESRINKDEKVMNKKAERARKKAEKVRVKSEKNREKSKKLAFSTLSKWNYVHNVQIVTKLLKNID